MDAAATLKLGELFRKVDALLKATSPELTLRQARVLLYVGSQMEGVDQGDMGHRLKEDKGYASRIVKRLSGDSFGVKRDEGLGLLKVNMPPDDMRRRVLSLSKKGEQALTQVLNKLS